MFSQNHLLVLHTVEILCNLILRNYWNSTCKIFELPYWTRIDFIYWTWAWKTLGLNFWTQIDFIITQQDCYYKSLEIYLNYL